VKNALRDGLGHGTHVAGVIAGCMPEKSRRFRVAMHISDEFGNETVEDRSVAEGTASPGSHHRPSWSACACSTTTDAADRPA
jgi:subtilisin family serine protease